MRQFFAAVESAAILAGGHRIEAQHLSEDIRGSSDAPPSRYRSAVPEYDERAAIEAALSHAADTLSRAAEFLCMGRTTLWRKMRTYGIGQA